MPIFIGDIHANWEWYNKVTAEYQDTIQVGDFGCGFEKWAPAPLNIDQMVAGNHQVFRGNHDDPAIIKTLPTYIPDGFYDKTGSVFCIGGGESTDCSRRQPGIDWWPDEQLSQEEMDVIQEAYLQAKPDLVASHECPEAVLLSMYPGHSRKPSRTALFLERLFAVHRPKKWVFGHHHQYFARDIFGTKFTCVPIDTMLEV